MSGILRDMRARAEPEYIRDAIKVYLFERLADGRVALITNVEFTTFKPDEAPPPGAIELPRKTAQELMDSLWECGLRPSEGSGSAGALRAVERHRDDLKEIVNRLLDIISRPTPRAADSPPASR